jgi:hypothetical protein
MAGKGKSLFSGIKDMLVEDDGSETAQPESQSTTGKAFNNIPNLSTPAQPLPMPPVYVQPTSAPMVDQAALEAVRSSALAPVLSGRPSFYVLFINMYEALGRPTNVTPVLAALKVANPSATKDAILADLAAHQGLLDNAANGAKSEYDRMAQEQLGGNDAEIAKLDEANRNAQAEIDRHTREIAERSARRQELQSQRLNAEAKINAARDKAANAVIAVQNELKTMQQLIAVAP